MIERLNRWDTSLFYWINQHHCAVSDWVLWTASQAWAWVPVLGAAYALVCRREGWRRWWLVLLGVGACFLLGDRLSVMCFKDVVCRLRPCHALEGVRMFHTRCGGLYGFVSSHAANASACAVFLSLLYKSAPSPLRGSHCLGATHSRGSRPGLRSYAPSGHVFSGLMFLWVLLVGYSRPYLGKHYPGDVLCGALLGVAIGALVYWLYRRISTGNPQRIRNKSAMFH